MRMLNGRVYGAKRGYQNRNPFATVRDEPEFVEWGRGSWCRVRWWRWQRVRRGVVRGVRRKRRTTKRKRMRRRKTRRRSRGGQRWARGWRRLVGIRRWRWRGGRRWVGASVPSATAARSLFTRETHPPSRDTHPLVTYCPYRPSSTRPFLDHVDSWMHSCMD
ncbi:hypothetical protein NEOLEDRAFT_498204 [Neolentinus lepideus HHB14362 ss-1]|uniref:Uncharacterized protein n=1 Tax=Neolentinus lepideus HHB14362 ss-1 TaxID=1314782 RepID=A0A165RP18_9AGAM|nr:hypothetical protein NEOLEDRAFT_498204 [Neolentinus lepideus HHB14362 ss-1]